MTADAPTPAAWPPQVVHTVRRAICCPSGICANAGADYDPIRGAVAICQAHTFEREADAALSALPPEYRAGPELYDALLAARDLIERPEGISGSLMLSVIDAALAKAKEPI